MNNAQLSVLGRQTSATTTILVIDEQLLVSSALAYSLRDLGFDAYSIRADLPAVKTAALAHPPGLVLLDLDLGSSPDGEPLEGIDLIAPLRAQGWTVLIITGTASLDRIADAIAQGALATLCLASALARHGLSDAIPAAPDIALPRGKRTPATEAIVHWHHFEPATFDLGRGPLTLDATASIGLYDAPRSIIDAFRMRATEGHELGYEALRRWLRTPGSQPGQLIRLAHQFPRAETPLRTALAALL